MFRLRFCAALLAFGALATSACSSPTTPPASCTSRPSSCGSSKTCWPSDNIGNYACMPGSTEPNTGPGDACQLLLGQPTCGAQLFCALLTPGSQDGECVPFCGTDNSCPSGSTCAFFYLTSTQKQLKVPVCVPLSQDAGRDSGPPDAGAEGAPPDTGRESAPPEGGAEASD